MIKAKPELNLRKAAIYAIVLNGLQILAMAGLTLYIMIDGVNRALQGIIGDLIVLTLSFIVTWGAIMDIRDALDARKMTVKLDGLDETVTQMSEMNHALRAQRHDFLNHLQVVYSLMEMKEYGEANRYIEQVYGDIQAVSRAMKTACAPINALLRAKIAEAEQKGIQVELKVKAAWDALPLPAWEMCRVLSNLIDNAMDALAGKKNPRLEIRLMEDVRGFSFEVGNNGPMIPEKAMETIFEPGFSEKGEGRGMGLSIARETLRSAEGDLTVSSDEAKTVFAGALPRLKIKAGEDQREN